MRDPARIDRMIELLRKQWHRYPDQRLGQLVSNFTHKCWVCPVGHAHAIRHTEDDKMEQALSDD